MIMKTHPKIDNTELEDCVRGFCEALLWVTIDHDQEDETFLEENYSIIDISHDSMRVIRDDCRLFMNKAGEHLDYSDLEQHGHDFFLTRQGHGVGFLDRDLPKEDARALDNIAQGFKELHVYAHNGKVEVE